MSDELTTMLREMKDRAGYEAACTPAPLGSKSCDDVSLLVAAVEAVLALADSLPPQAPPSSALEEDQMWIRQECADMIRETVTRVLVPGAAGDAEDKKG